MQSTITEKIAVLHVHFPRIREMHCSPKIFKKANGCFLLDRRKAGDLFVYSAKISYH